MQLPSSNANRLRPRQIYTQSRAALYGGATKSRRCPRDCWRSPQTPPRSLCRTRKAAGSPDHRDYVPAALQCCAFPPFKHPNPAPRSFAKTPHQSLSRMRQNAQSLPSFRTRTPAPTALNDLPEGRPGASKASWVLATHRACGARSWLR